MTDNFPKVYYVTLTMFQIVSHFDSSRYIDFDMYLGIHYILDIYRRNYVF
jgi:hypothetical protein